jgi:hypothetical protein
MPAPHRGASERAWLPAKCTSPLMEARKGRGAVASRGQPCASRVVERTRTVCQASAAGGPEIRPRHLASLLVDACQRLVPPLLPRSAPSVTAPSRSGRRHGHRTAPGCARQPSGRQSSAAQLPERPLAAIPPPDSGAPRDKHTPEIPPMPRGGPTACRRRSVWVRLHRSVADVRGVRPAGLGHRPSPLPRDGIAEVVPAADRRRRRLAAVRRAPTDAHLPGGMSWLSNATTSSSWFSQHLSCSSVPSPSPCETRAALLKRPRGHRHSDADTRTRFAASGAARRTAHDLEGVRGQR